ncbi:MAG: hypothetical protein ACE5FQ_13560 [Thiogranum sp.]
MSRPSLKVGTDMAATKETRRQAQNAIARALSTNGPFFDLSRLWETKYPEVPRATWYRWVAKVRDSGVPGRLFAKRIKQRVARRAQHPE